MNEKKRPRPRGQLTDLGGGSYRIRVPLGTKLDGSRPYHNETLHNSTDAKARRRLAAVLAQVDGGTFFVASSQTVSELLAEYIDRLRRKGRKPSTLDAYGRQVDYHIGPALGKIALGALSTDAVQSLYDGMQDKEFHPRTIWGVHCLLTAALSYAVKRGRIERNPAAAADLPPAGRPKKARVFDEPEAIRFIEECRRVPRDLLFVFVLMSGLRPCEFSGLEYPQLSLEEANGVERGVAVIDRTIVPARGGGYHYGTPKTESSNRRVYFPAMLYHDLMERKGAQLDFLKRMGQPRELVFANVHGRPLGGGSVYQRFLIVCRRAGVGTEGRSLYTLRRWHATLTLLAGDSLKALSERMGHKSVQFTQNEYIDALPVMQQATADRLENLLLRTNLAQDEAGRVM